MTKYIIAILLSWGCGPAGADIADPDPNDTGLVNDTSDPSDTDLVDDTSTDTFDTDADTDTAVDPLVGITYLSSPGPLDMDAWEGTAYPETIRGEATGLDWTCDHPLVYVRGLAGVLSGSGDFEVVMHTWNNERDGGELGSLIVVHCAVTSDQDSVPFVVNAWRVTP